MTLGLQKLDYHGLTSSAAIVGSILKNPTKTGQIEKNNKNIVLKCCLCECSVRQSMGVMVKQLHFIFGLNHPG